jgi:hypothetical protein
MAERMPGLRASNAINRDLCMLLPAFHRIQRLRAKITVNNQCFPVLIFDPATIQILL